MSLTRVWGVLGGANHIPTCFKDSTPNLLPLQIIWERRSYHWHQVSQFQLDHTEGPCYLSQHSRYSINSLCFWDHVGIR